MRFEDYSVNRKRNREFLDDSMTNNLVKGLNEYFQSYVDVSRVRVGLRQKTETFIDEEALLLAQYLRNEKQTWIPKGCPFELGSSCARHSILTLLFTLTQHAHTGTRQNLCVSARYIRWGKPPCSA
jgi:hypothetical protein